MGGVGGVQQGFSVRKGHTGEQATQHNWYWLRIKGRREWER